MAFRAGAISAVLALLVACAKKEPEIQGGMPIDYSLRELTNDADLIAEGSLVGFDAQSRKAEIRLREAIQGRIATPELEVDFSGGVPVATESLWMHLVPGMPILWYSSNGCAMVYVNRFFIWCYATGDIGAGKWQFTYVETRANRTYNGSAKDLGPLMRDIVSGRIPSPPLDPRLKEITIADLRALPVWGEPVDEDYLPLCFRRGEAPPVAFRTPENPPGVLAGLRTTTYQGPWSEPQNFDACDVLERGVADSLSVAAFPTTESLRVQFQAYLEVPKDGTYVFTLRGDALSAASLRIGTAEVVSISRDSTRDRGGDIALKAGKHAFRLRCSALEGKRTFQVFWTGPGFTRRPIPANALSRVP